VVHHGENRIQAPDGWQISDEIHGKVGERTSRSGSWNRQESRAGQMAIDLELLAICATFDIILDEGSHARPPIVDA